MLLKQIIITESIPFEVKLTHPAYTIEQEVEETRATMAMENMSLTDEETQMLMDYANGEVSGDDLRRRIFDSITDEDRGATAEHSENLSMILPTIISTP